MESHYLLSYLTIIAAVVFALLVNGGILFLNKILATKPKEVTPKKGDTYECGVPPEGEGNQQFSVRYYVVGIIFLIFDVDVVLMYPWALVYKKFIPFGPWIIIEMAIFLLFLVAGYLYLQRRRALDWD